MVIYYSTFKIRFNAFDVKNKRDRDLKEKKRKKDKKKEEEEELSRGAKDESHFVRAAGPEKEVAICQPECSLLIKKSSADQVKGEENCACE